MIDMDTANTIAHIMMWVFGISIVAGLFLRRKR